MTSKENLYFCTCILDYLSSKVNFLLINCLESVSLLNLSSKVNFLLINCLESVSLLNQYDYLRADSARDMLAIVQLN